MARGHLQLLTLLGPLAHDQFVDQEMELPEAELSVEVWEPTPAPTRGTGEYQRGHNTRNGDRNVLAPHWFWHKVKAPAVVQSNAPVKVTDEGLAKATVARARNEAAMNFILRRAGS